jgi:hypothetical protein
MVVKRFPATPVTIESEPLLPSTMDAGALIADP